MTQPFQDEHDDQGVPANPGGSLQLAVEGAQRWWRNFGRREMETMFGFQIPPNDPIEAAAVMGFLCGRLELTKKEHWSKVQVAINDGKARGQILVPGHDPSAQLTEGRT